MTAKEAMKILLKDFHIADYVCDVRDYYRGEEDGYEGDSWDHPKVKEFSEIIKTLEAWTKE